MAKRENLGGRGLGRNRIPENQMQEFMDSYYLARMSGSWKQGELPGHEKHFL